MKKKILMATLFSIAMVCSALAQEVKVVKIKTGKGCSMTSTVTTGCTSKDGANTKVVVMDGTDDKKPLIIVNGKVYTKDLDSISPDDIESIDVVKGDAATEEYGVKAKDGVIKITMKSPMDVAKALIVIDGKVSKKKYSQIKPKDIKSMNVLKGKAAVDKYGEKAANGVIELTTK